MNNLSREEIINLGETLGLTSSRLQGLGELNLLSEMIKAWLNQEDHGCLADKWSPNVEELIYAYIYSSKTYNIIWKTIYIVPRDIADDNY